MAGKIVIYAIKQGQTQNSLLLTLVRYLGTLTAAVVSACFILNRKKMHLSKRQFIIFNEDTIILLFMTTDIA